MNLLQQLEKAGFTQQGHFEYRHTDGRVIQRVNNDWIVTPPGNDKRSKAASFRSLKLAAESVLGAKKK